MKLGIVGVGAVAELHVSAIRQVSGLDLIAIADADPARAAARSIEWQVPAFATVDELLDHGAEAVLVLTHPGSHLDIARACIEAGRHVFVEKPVSDDADGIDALAAYAASQGVVCMPGHNYAHIPEFRRLARLARGGELGTIRSMFVTYVIPHTEQIAGHYGGVLGEVMVHHSYLTLAVLGAPQKIVAGVADPAWVAHPVEDQAWMTWQYGGASAHLFASFATEDYSADPWTCIVKVLGTEGSAVVNWRNSMYQRVRGSHAYGWDQYEESFADELTSFRDAIADGAPVPSTMSDAATSARIIVQAYRSAAEGTVIDRLDGAGVARW